LLHSRHTKTGLRFADQETQLALRTSAAGSVLPYTASAVIHRQEEWNRQGAEHQCHDGIR
jgi:hypothetical protein